MKKIFLSLFLVFAVSSVYGPCFSFCLNAETADTLAGLAALKGADMTLYSLYNDNLAHDPAQNQLPSFRENNFLI